MVAATSLAIFLVPVLFVLISKLSYSKKRLAFLREHRTEIAESRVKEHEQQIQHMLETDLEEKLKREQGKHGKK